MNDAFFPALVCSALIGVAASGCDDAKARPAGLVSSAAPADKGAAQRLPSNATAELEEVKNDKLGYTIKVPKGSQTTMADGNGGMYTKDTMIINVEPSGVKLAAVDDVLRAVNVGDGKVEKKTEGDTFIAIVEKKDSPVNIYAGPKGAKIQSHCMAEPDQKALAIQVCSSLKSTK